MELNRQSISPRGDFRVTADGPLGYETSNDYVAASNGKRFLVAIRATDPDAPPISIVVNRPELLKR